MTRQNQVEEECVAKINTDKGNPVDSETKFIGYMSNGLQTGIVDNQYCVAKVVTDVENLESKFFVKSHYKVKSFFDPSLLPESILKSKIRGDDKYIYQWEKVSKDSFENYLSYLKGRSNNAALLQQAQRVKNGC